jgi:thiamine pyrophosphate-dependent acetolactate synthase large subunit-like protein
MGFALPAAMAAKLARPEKQVLCLVGDGGLGTLGGDGRRLEKAEDLPALIEEGLGSGKLFVVDVPTRRVAPPEVAAQIH